MNFKERYEECVKLIKKKDSDTPLPPNKNKEFMACVFPLLHDITRLQDQIQLSAFGVISQYPEYGPRGLIDVHEQSCYKNVADMVNSANAIILEASNYKYHPSVVEGSYVPEKIRFLNIRQEDTLRRLKRIEELKSLE